MSGADERVLRRAVRVITARIAAVITGLLVFLGVLVYVLVTLGQQADVTRETDYALAHANPSSPPACVWLFELDGAKVTGSGRAPAGMPVMSELTALATDPAPRRIDVSANGTQYVVRTELRGGRRVQVVFDRRYQLSDRDSLLLALGIGELAGFLGALLTGRWLARRAIVPLGEALARQRRFVTDASHELRTPLTQLHTRAQLLVRRARKHELPAAVAAELDRLVVGSRQLGEVIEDLLLAAQLEHGAVPAEQVDLVEIATRAVAADSARADQLGLAVEVHAATTQATVLGARTALLRVVSSLVDNAIGHTAPGGRISLELRRAHAGATVELVISDSGVGLDPRDVQHVFDRFSRGAHGRGRRFGLGLALVREVLERHGGTISAGDAPGGGAQFVVRLPAASTDPAIPPVRPDVRLPAQSSTASASISTSSPGGSPT